MISFSDLIHWTKQQVISHNIDYNQSDIFQLLQHCFSVSRNKMILNYNKKQSYDASLFKVAVIDYVKGKPLDLIIGHTDFLNHQYHVRQGVLLPRPETEIVVQCLLDTLKDKHIDDFVSIECGIGTGIISLECALAYPKATCCGWDISEQAYECALTNKKNLDVKNCHFYLGDFFSGEAYKFIKHRSNNYKILVSNPPYIRSQDIASLDISVLDYETKLALDGGENGMDFYLKLVKKFYIDVDLMCFEIGINQRHLFEDILSEYSNSTYFFVNDYQNIPRVLIIECN